MQTLTNNQKIHYTLRVAAAMCFIGHGAFGIITKAIWCNYFALFGIDKVHAYQIMPVLGMVDILMGLILLFKPVRAIAVWLVIWGIITASCRPLSGESFAEFIERAGNYGTPLALLALAGGIQWNFKWLFSAVNPQEPVSEKSLARVKLILRFIVFLLLMGHGWLNLIQKQGLINQYTALGFSNPVNVSILAGIFEIMAAIAVLVKPVRPLIAVFFIWKMGTELFYPHFEIFEWVERGGSYGTLLALWLCLDPSYKTENNFTNQRTFSVD
ncbi:MAG TPA: DoxX family membrane protein [Puia sp.]|jgi:hypothetical protein|nr:DoxX family membrane protein [Puia sp.]